MKRAFTENIFEAPEDEIVCWCSEVSKKEILDAIAEGARDIEDIRRMTKACTVGRCKEVSPRGRCCSKEITMLIQSAKNKTGGVY